MVHTLFAYLSNRVKLGRSFLGEKEIVVYNRIWRIFLHGVVERKNDWIFLCEVLKSLHCIELEMYPRRVALSSYAIFSL